MNLIQKATAYALPLLVAMSTGIGPALAVPNAPKIIPGNVAYDQTNKLTSEIHWYQSLPQAEAAARSQSKLVFWMHMLGHLDGAT
jgi:hypothetical protein